MTTIRLSTTELSFKITLERGKELLKKNSVLANQLKESCDKMNNLRIRQEKENESLQTEIKDLKVTLVMREKCHAKQKDIFMNELNKARAVISNLSEGMKAYEGKSNA